MAQASLGRDYFARVYAQSTDPWNFETSAYERAKYDATIDALGERRFARGLEVGCSVGVLTARLAQCCASLVSIDLNERALDAARRRNALHAGVRFELMAFPEQAPSGRFDLIVFSEVGYYWSDDDLAAAIDYAAHAAAGGIVELVHYLPKVDDYLRDGDDVHRAFLHDARFERERGSRAPCYRIDVLRVRG